MSNSGTRPAHWFLVPDCTARSYTKVDCISRPRDEIKFAPGVRVEIKLAPWIVASPDIDERV